MRPLANTIHLVALRPDNTPATGTSNAECGIGSGCIIRVDGALALIGVRHVTQNSLRWSMHVEYSQSAGSCSYIMGAPTFIDRFCFSDGEVTELDFFVLPVDLPRLPKHQEWLGFNVLSDERPKRIFDLADISEPTFEDEYCFGGLVQPCRVDGLHRHSVFEVHPTEQFGLKYIAEEPAKLTFALPMPHPGHETYLGCSGAPIVSSNGRLVSLVMGGCVTNNHIYGLPLNRYASAISATILQSKG